MQPLVFQDQIALVIELRDRFRSGRPANEIRELFNRLKKRDDLLARTEREINSVLEEIAGGRIHKEPPKQPSKGSPGEADKKPARQIDKIPSRIKAREQDAKKTARTECHLHLKDGVQECSRLMQDVANGNGGWVFEIDPENKFILVLDKSQKKPLITATGELRDGATGTRAQELKKLGWEIEEHGFVKGAAGAAALYATGGIAALALQRVAPDIKTIIVRPEK